MKLRNFEPFDLEFLHVGVLLAIYMVWKEYLPFGFDYNFLSLGLRYINVFIINIEQN